LNIFSRTFHVGPYEIEAIAAIENGQAVSLEFAWSPDRPASLTDAQIADYHPQRDAVIAELASEIGAMNPRVLEV
jgi:hypothetical protein